MRFLVDNALSPLLADGLHQVGHDAVHVRDYQMQAAKDAAIFDRARSFPQILILALLAAWPHTEPFILFRGGTERQPQRHGKPS
jgi:hypothetical protein